MQICFDVMVLMPSLRDTGFIKFHRMLVIVEWIGIELTRHERCRIPRS